jgi:uncharacterized glyoxalase superfamily protein PhnB
MNCIPFLNYDDAEAAIDWLEQAFGFERSLVHNDPSGRIAHAELVFDGGMVMLGASGPHQLGMKTARELGAVTQGVYVIVGGDVDDRYARAVAAGAEVVRELGDTDYGSRDFIVRDPEGNLWSFGTYRPE